MAIASGLVRAACNTTTGTQDFRDPNMTETPNAALFIVSSGITDGTAAAHSIFCLGATDGTNEWSVGGAGRDAVTTSVTKRRYLSDKCIYIINTYSGVDGEADFSSWLSDAGSGAGVQINWTNAPSSAWLLTVILLKVDNAQAGIYTTSGTVGGTTTVTTGFQPTLIFGAADFQSSADVGTSNQYFSFGACDGSLNQASYAYYDRNGRGTSELRNELVTDALVASMSLSGVGSKSEITSITATQFVATQRIAGDTSSIGYLAIDTGTVGAWVGTFASPTSTGNQSITSPAFEPQFVLQGLGLTEAIDTYYTDGRAGGLGIGAFTANSEYSTVISSEDGVVTSNCQSLSDNVAVNLPDDAGTALCTASFVSMDATGWTLNHTAVSATAKYWFGVAIEAESTSMTTFLQFETDLSEIDAITDPDADFNWSAAAAMNSTSGGIAITIDDTTPTYGTYLIDPTEAVTDGVLHVSFYIDPNSMTMASGDRFNVLRVTSDGPYYRALTFNLSYLSGQYEVDAVVFTDAGSYDATGVPAISDGPHLIEIDLYRASNSTAADGYLEFTIDGGVVHSTTTVDNYDVFAGMSGIIFGAYSAIDSGTSGTFYFDELQVGADHASASASILADGVTVPQSAIFGGLVVR